MTGVGAGLMPVDAADITVGLADTLWVGHHRMYFREFIASLERLGVFVIALCPQPEDLTPHPRLATGQLLVPDRSPLRHGLTNDPVLTVLRWRRTRRALEATENRCGRRADLVFFPYLDNYLRFLPLRMAPELLLGRPWSGLYFRNHHLSWPADGTRAWLKRLAKGDRILRSPTTLPFVGVLDDRFNTELAARSGRTALVFPDVTDETLPALPTTLSESLRDLAKGRPIIGVAGSLERRKGLLTLLRVAEACQGHDPWFFAAVGPFVAETFSAAELAWIKEARLRLDESLYLDLTGSLIPDEASFNAAFRTFDVAWAAYDDFQGSSNILTKAAYFEKVVLATDGEYIASMVEEYQLGASFRAGDIHAARVALQQLLGEPKRGDVFRRFSDYRELNSRQQLDDVLRRVITSIPAAA